MQDAESRCLKLAGSRKLEGSGHWWVGDWRWGNLAACYSESPISIPGLWNSCYCWYIPEFRDIGLSGYVLPYSCAWLACVDKRAAYSEGHMNHRIRDLYHILVQS